MKQAIYSFNASEIATILHALRVIQEQADGPKLCVYGSCEHFDEFPELTNAQIDELCERINPLDADQPQPPKEPTEQEAAYIQAAREQWTNDELEIDDNPTVSTGADNGAWVAAWVWVADIDAGICSECGEVNADNGEGYDGLCGNCADKAEGSAE